VRTFLGPLLIALLAVGALSTPLDARPGGKGKVPVEAERVLNAVAAAFRAGDAEAVCRPMAEGRDARLHLNLKGVTSGPYTREQATETLKTQYFAKRKVVSLKRTDECATCDEWAITRSYLMTYRVGDDEMEGPLSVRIERKKLVKDEYGWFLTALAER
jgi:hypothetical protein